MKNKKNEKLFIVLASIVLIMTIVMVVILATRKQKPNDEIVLPEDDIQIAETMIVPNDNSIQLVNIDGTILDKIDGKIKFHTNDNNDIMYIRDNTFYTLNIKQDADTSKLVENKILDVENVDDFRFNDSYIVTLTKLDNTENENIDILDENNEVKDTTEKIDATKSNLTKHNKITASSNFYNVSFIDRKTLKEVNKIENIELDNFIIDNDKFIYSVGNYVYSYNITSNETTELYLGKRISDLSIMNDNIIIYDKFGNGVNKSLLLRTNDDLKVNKTTKHDASNIIAIQKDVEENNIIYIEDDKTPILYMLNLDGDREVKKKKSLNLDIKGKYNQENTIYSKGYVYTAKDGKINIIDLKSSTIYKTYDIEANFIYPIYSNSDLIIK